MSGPNQGSESDEPDRSQLREGDSEPSEGLKGETDDSDQTSATETYPEAYSAPESEHFSSGPFVPADLALYDYDEHDKPVDAEADTPRWPWAVGIVAIVAAIVLVIAVSLLVARKDTNDLATPSSEPTSTPPMQDEISVTTPPPTSKGVAPPPPPTSKAVPPPPPPTSEAPPPPQTETETPEPPPPPPAAAPPPVTTTAPPGPRQVTYSVTGIKAPFDVITVTYVDASGQRRVLRNVFIPWSITLTPISQSEVGSVEASSLLRLSKINCSITTSDGTVLSSNNGDQPQTSC
jgi:hypothetical protein